MDQGWLWFKVMVAKYGVEGGQVRRGGILSFVWWKDIYDIFEGGGR